MAHEIPRIRECTTILSREREWCTKAPNSAFERAILPVYVFGRAVVTESSPCVCGEADQPLFPNATQRKTVVKYDHVIRNKMWTTVSKRLPRQSSAE